MKTDLKHLKASASTAMLIAGLFGANARAANGSDQHAVQSSEAGDIVVTAQRREERLQDIGMSVSAQTGDELKLRGVLTATDIAGSVPSLRMNAYSSSAVVFNIRGVSQNDFGDQQEPPIAVYQDDSYASTIVTAGFPVFDLARTEVLRGPQGTLFGRNATGGAVQFISEQPTRSFEGYARASYESYDALRLEGAVSGPLSDTLSARVASRLSHGGDYYRSVIPGGQDLGGDHNFALRGILKWEPSSDVTGRLTVRYLEGDKERSGGFYTHQPTCFNAQSQGEFLGANQSCPALGSPPGAIATGYRNDAINPERGGNPWRTAATFPTYIDRKIFGSQFRLDAALGSFDLVSITDYQHLNKYYTEDTDGTPDAAATYVTSVKLDQISQELRMSRKTDRNFLTVGANFMSIKGKYGASYSVPYIDYFPDVRFQQNTRSFAFFGQDEFEITPRVKLIAGLRYWNDQRTLYYRGTEAGTGVDLTINPDQIVYRLNGAVQPLAGVTLTPSDARKTFSGVTGRASIEFKVADGVLTYFSYNRGSKSGGYTVGTATPFPAAVVDTLNTTFYRPEKIDAYEVGIKSKLARGTTLNVSAFYYDYRDYQAFEQYGLTQTIANLNAKSYGVEAEFATRPIAGLSFELNASYLRTRVYNVRLQDLVTVVTHDLPQAPRFSGSALVRYEHQIGAGSGFVQGNVSWQGNSCFNVLCAPVDQEKGYAVANVRVGYTLGGTSLQLYVSNVTNTQYRMYSTDNTGTAGFVSSVYARPRVFGATIEQKF